jgi:hypothetical protein
MQLIFSREYQDKKVKLFTYPPIQAIKVIYRLMKIKLVARAQ